MAFYENKSTFELSKKRQSFTSEHKRPEFFFFLQLT